MPKYLSYEPIFFTPPLTKLNKKLYKDSPDAATPDPQIGIAALKSAENGKEALDFYKKEYELARPNQERLNALALQQQEQLIATGKENSGYAKDYYNYMQSTFRPLEKSIVDNANNFDTAGRREGEAARGLADVTQGFDRQRQITQRNNERTGINPNSGNAQAINQELAVQEAIAGADAMNKGRKNAEMTGNAMKMDAASLGRNLPSNQVASQQLANNSSQQGLNADLSAAANQRAGLSVMGAGYQANGAGLNQQAGILNNQFSNQIQSYNAQNANNSSVFGDIGSVVGAGAALYSLKDGGELDKTKLGLSTLAEAKEPYADDENYPNHNEASELFTGHGKVKGAGTTTSDSVPAMLSDEEFVQNAGVQKMTKQQIIAAAQKVKSNSGLSVLKAINKAGLKYREAN